jgi:hypothetical protein
VYDGGSNAPGLATLENHVNFTANGTRVPDGPVLPTKDQLPWTFEGALGITRTWEVGLYLQTALLSDGTPEFAGAKLRSKHIAPPLWNDRLWLGANFELGAIPRKFEADVWGVEVRPIAALALPYLRAAINPILSLPLDAAASDGPDFEPAVSLKGVPIPPLAVGLEYYGDIGPLVDPLPAREQQHYLYGAADLDLPRGWAINFGVGGRIAGAADAVVIKAIVGFELGRLWQPLE